MGGLGGGLPNYGFAPFPMTFLSTTRNTTAQSPTPTRRTYCESAEMDCGSMFSITFFLLVAAEALGSTTVRDLEEWADWGWVTLLSASRTFSCSSLFSWSAFSIFWFNRASTSVMWETFLSTSSSRFLYSSSMRVVDLTWSSSSCSRLLLEEESSTAWIKPETWEVEGPGGEKMAVTIRLSSLGFLLLLPSLDRDSMMVERLLAVASGLMLSECGKSWMSFLTVMPGLLSNSSQALAPQLELNSSPSVLSSSSTVGSSTGSSLKLGWIGI